MRMESTSSRTGTTRRLVRLTKELIHRSFITSTSAMITTAIGMHSRKPRRSLRYIGSITPGTHRLSTTYTSRAPLARVFFYHLTWPRLNLTCQNRSLKVIPTWGIGWRANCAQKGFRVLRQTPLTTPGRPPALILIITGAYEFFPRLPQHVLLHPSQSSLKNCVLVKAMIP